MENKKLHIIDLASLEALFRTHYQLLCQTAYYVIGDEDAARDIVQEFFYYCWNKRKDLSINQDFKNYATRAIKNACINYIKKARRNVAGDELIWDNLPEGEKEEQPGPEEEKRNKALWEAIDRLPEQRRKIFLLSNKDGLTYAQIAEKLDISVNTVKTQIRLAYQYLREECRWLIPLLIAGYFF